jgi:hypothetical protein
LAEKIRAGRRSPRQGHPDNTVQDASGIRRKVKQATTELPKTPSQLARRYTLIIRQARKAIFCVWDISILLSLRKTFDQKLIHVLFNNPLYFFKIMRKSQNFASSSFAL